MHIDFERRGLARSAIIEDGSTWTDRKEWLAREWKDEHFRVRDYSLPQTSQHCLQGSVDAGA
jgi:hypothetical protein